MANHNANDFASRFAMGGRMCIGYNFALLEVKIFLCHLLYRYHFEKEGEAGVETDPFFQLMRYAKSLLC
jgi:cytochrome P450